ncbi:hypothetical protein EV368DRAFT_62119 [Lentinula lateritia]|nr:hypothetical protein EV368DRAFT_62119 [Lentinula lateritia]
MQNILGICVGTTPCGGGYFVPNKLEVKHDQNVPGSTFSQPIEIFCLPVYSLDPPLCPWQASACTKVSKFQSAIDLASKALAFCGRSLVYSEGDFGTQVSTKTNPSVRSPKSSEVHFVKKRDDERWFKQLEASLNRKLKTYDAIDQSKKVFWIDYSPTHRWQWCKGYGQPVFGKDLTSKLIERVSFSKKGFNNNGIFSLQTDYTVGSGENVRTYPRQTVIAKLINRRFEAGAACEVWALNHFGLLIEAGRMTAEAQNTFGVIVMHKQPGKPLTDVEEWYTAPVDQKRAVVQDLRKQVQDLIYRWIQEKGVVHADFDPDNVLVDVARNKETNTVRLEHFAIVDFGPPGVWLRTKVPSEQTFTTWFNARWDFLWEEVIEKLGHAPDPKQEQKTQRRRLKKIDY